MPELTRQEEYVFERSLRTGDINLFTEFFFRLPDSGTYFTPLDRIEQYQVLHEVWKAAGEPDDQFDAEVDGQPTEFRVRWDVPYYGNEPLFLLPHGFRMLPWLDRFLTPSVPLGIAITGTGTGKAQPLDAKILTPDGWTTMGKIGLGDVVIGADGGKKRVLGVYPQGVRDIYKVTFNDGSSTEVDGDHLWRIDRSSKGWRVVKTSDLRPEARDYIQMMEPAQYTSDSLPIPPYTLGALLGDGCFRKETVIFSCADQEIIDRIETEIPDGMHLSYQSQYDYYIANKVRAGSHGNELLGRIHELGLFGKYSHEKFIPDCYLHASVSDRIALLQGLLDTDGGLSSPSGIEYTSTSMDLARGVRELVWSLGGKCTMSIKETSYTYNGDKKQGKTCYRLYINFSNPTFNPFHLPRKADGYRPKDYRIIRRVVSVKYVGAKVARCIKVEGQLYVTDDYIVTHNTCGVAIWALACCALFPGFRFLNVAPSRVQAELMLNEIEKWCMNTRFRKFIVESNGVHPLWVARPHAQLRVEVNEGFYSTFVCQTVNRDATSVLGQEQDFINCDEAQLLENISESVPILATRMRGTRSTGQPRWGMLRWISNPGRNPELVALMEHYGEIEQKSGQAIVLEGINSSVNTYVTKAQLEKQKLSMMSAIDEDRWHGGDMSAAAGSQLIPEELLEKCRSKTMDKEVAKIALYDDMLGLREFALPFEEGHSYVVAGDVGQSNASSMSSMNVPCVMVFDVTRFLDRPIELAAFWWKDGNGSYRPFIKAMQRYMIAYRATGFYDATNVQTALEDVKDAGFDGWPTTPVYFSGSVVPKRWAVTIITKMMDDEMFRWPYIKAMWHQARVFDIATKKKADDIIATLMVFGLALRMEDTLWTKLEERYNWKVDPDEDWAEHTVVSTNQRPAARDRFSRIAMPRW